MAEAIILWADWNLSRQGNDKIYVAHRKNSEKSKMRLQNKIKSPET